MKELNLPHNLTLLEVACSMNRRDALGLWLAMRSNGNVLDIGCGEGQRLQAWAIMLLRLKRRVIGLDWSNEHRIHELTRTVPMRFALGRKATATGVEIRDIDPALCLFDDFQPLGFAFLDYDYRVDALRHTCPQLIESIRLMSLPNSVMAWGGYRYPREKKEKKEPNDVMNYVASLDKGDTYHFTGTDIIFQLYNATTPFREALRALAK